MTVVGRLFVIDDVEVLPEDMPNPKPGPIEVNSKEMPKEQAVFIEKAPRIDWVDYKLGSFEKLVGLDVPGVEELQHSNGCPLPRSFHAARSLIHHSRAFLLCVFEGIPL